ncbi:MAG: imidazole glycerol phosphate synthase subunit HisH [Patescibacteria group bacterium]|nr:imidazole glycerol phosphate synthase subunit HisH [Patescibacteria group bacterium]
MIAIIDYKMGNLRSIANAFGLLGAETVIAQTPEILSKAEAIVIPGVGAFRDGMKNLQELGFTNALQEEVAENKKPFLGVCLGLQLIAKRSFENGEYEGLDWIDFDVKKITPQSGNFRIPHMGWNELEIKGEGGVLLQGIPKPAVVYFVHSYFLQPNSKASEKLVTSTCFHGETITASVEQENIFGCQFHPEKSQNTGLAVLRNFIEFAKKHA